MKPRTTRIRRPGRILRTLAACLLPSLLCCAQAGEAAMIVHPGEGGAWVLEWQGKAYRCSVGKHGVVPASRKREGDGCTPSGTFLLRGLYYRADRIGRDELRTALPATALTQADGWCDDPGDPAYNRPVKLPHPAHHEELWREKDALYDLIVPLGYNDDPVASGRGSAIFLHIASPSYGPTAGCVAVSRNDLLALLKTLGPGDRITILPARP